MFTQGALNQKKVTSTIVKKSDIYDSQPKHPARAVIRQKIDEPYKRFYTTKPWSLVTTFCEESP